MKLQSTPFESFDWESVERTIHAGETGEARWRTRHLGDVRVRRVDYSPGYTADHWCLKGHVLFCLSGELHTELANGEVHVLRAGMSYLVGDDAMAHRSSTPTGASLFIVD